MQEKAIWQAVKKHRFELAGFVEALSEEEWDTPSLCKGWLVRDVVAHVVLESRYTRQNSWAKLAKNGFNPYPAIPRV